MTTRLVPAEPRSESALTSRIVLHLDHSVEQLDLELPTNRFARQHPLIEEDPFPTVGKSFLHYTIVEELGQGGFARAYLAKQESLAHRLVVLKISSLFSDEPQKLARLQHANIVPVYSVHAVKGLEAICMPYLGRTTLLKVMNVEDGRRCDLSHTLQGHGGKHVDTAIWLVAQLAAGLAHSHERGILHRDIKPANVLLTDDGVPMLLDFNVSSESPLASASDRIGGTFQYMAPEHLQAYDGAFTDVDQRSDLYSLGVILYELLTGELPHPPKPDDCYGRVSHDRMVEARQVPPRKPSEFDRSIPPSVDAIALKLLESQPSRRYQHASELHDDLSRQLDNRPLKHARSRSVSEGLKKWRKRNPRLVTGLAVAAIALFALILPAVSIAADRARERDRLEAMQKAEAVNQFRTACDEISSAAVMLGSRTDPLMREEGAKQAVELLDRYEVVANAEWEASPAFQHLAPVQRQELKEGFGELLILLTRIELQKPARGDAAKWNRLATVMFAETPAVVSRQQAEIVGQISEPTARQDLDDYFDGLDLAAAGRCREALPLLAKSCSTRPGHFQSWFARGICQEFANQPADAVASFSVCIALRPEFAYSHLNRGLAHLKARRPAEAEADFTRALELKPGWLPARINRGLVRDSLRRPKDAEGDYRAALSEPACPARVWFLRARVKRLLGDEVGYAADRAEGLKRQPTDGLSYRTRGTWLRAAREFDKALADFDAALKLNPADTDALLHKGIVLADDLHKEADALPVFDRLLELAPDNVDARCSRGVYHARLGHAVEARRDAIDSLKADGSAYRLFQVAGLHAQLAKTDPKAKLEAVQHLARALRAGFNNPELVKSDHDLDPIRAEPAVTKLLASVKEVEDIGK